MYLDFLCQSCILIPCWHIHLWTRMYVFSSIVSCTVLFTPREFIYTVSFRHTCFPCGQFTFFAVISSVYSYLLVSLTEQLSKLMANGWYMASLTLLSSYPACIWHMNFRGVIVGIRALGFIFPRV